MAAIFYDYTACRRRPQLGPSSLYTCRPREIPARMGHFSKLGAYAHLDYFNSQIAEPTIVVCNG